MRGPRQTRSSLIKTPFGGVRILLDNEPVPTLAVGLTRLAVGRPAPNRAAPGRRIRII